MVPRAVLLLAAATSIVSIASIPIVVADPAAKDFGAGLGTPLRE